MDATAIHCYRDVKGRTGVGGWGGNDECSMDVLDVRGCGIAKMVFYLLLTHLARLDIEV